MTGVEPVTQEIFNGTISTHPQWQWVDWLVHEYLPFCFRISVTHNHFFLWKNMIFFLAEAGFVVIVAF